MACKICNQKIITILENYKAIDIILFPNTTPKEKLSEADLSTYKRIKKSLLLNVLEINNINEYVSQNEYSSLDEMVVESFANVSEILGAAKEILTSDQSIKILNEEINENTNINENTVKNYLTICLDKLMLEKSFKQSNVNINENYKGKIIFAAYKSFRDDLINISLK